MLTLPVSYTTLLLWLNNGIFVKRFALCYRIRIVVCPVLSVCLSVTLVYCGQTIAWIKTKQLAWIEASALATLC